MSVIKPFMFTMRDDRNVFIRSITPDDAQNVLDFLAQVFRESDSLINLPGEFNLTAQEEVAFIQRLTQDSASVMIGVFDQGRCIAVCNAHPILGKAKMRHHATFGISILADYRGAGLGARIMRTLCDWADNHPFIEKLTLGVMADNPVAIGLYKRFHFVQVGRLSQHFRQPDGRYVDDILMERYRRVPMANLAMPN